MSKYYKKHRLLFACSIILTIISNILMLAVRSVLKQNMIDSAIKLDAEEITKYLILLIFWSAASVSVFIVANLVQNAFSNKVTNDMRFDVFSNILHREIRDFVKANTADYISAISNDISTIKRRYIGLSFSLLFSVVGIMVSTGLLVYFQPFVALLALIGSGTMTIVPIVLGKRQMKYEAKRSETLAKLTTLMTECFSGFEVISSFGIHRHMEKRFMNASIDLLRIEYKTDGMETVANGMGQFFSGIVQAIILGMSCWMVYKGQMSIGAMTVFLSINATFCSNLSMIMRVIPLIKGVQPVLRRIQELDEYQTTNRYGEMIPSFQSNLSVKDLSFCYVPDTTILERVSLDIQAGGKYAIVGESGSGKTTLIRLLLGYFEDYCGSICYDGKELRTLNHIVLNQIVSVIHQNVFIFDDTVYNNICLYEEFPPEQLEWAMQKSGVTKFIDTLPGGIHYQVGEHGARLSGGQRQRIAIARAMIRNANFLILDEGTSSLDELTATEIEEELLEVPNLTVLTITHRLRKIDRYRKIWQIKNGRITEVLPNEIFA